MERSTIKTEPVCRWDHQTPVITSPYRTPLGPEYPAVGFKVCGPGCSERPHGAVCFDSREVGK
ncbi:hypothetical protein LCGC14_0396950 [marine sediment metagenome]|uniref:Uncharacterized protein n=1 Tax=marine sediment metagenome TaxID=412755 RepID=A0A0F9TFW3_9ZZZZ